MSDANQTGTKPRRGGRYLLALLPLVVFGGIAATEAKMLYDQDFHGKNIAEIPSALIGTKAPALNLPPLEGANLPALTDDAIRGKLTLVNVFASWCIPCRDEHPILKQLAEDGRLNIVAINYKDRPENALRFLGELRMLNDHRPKVVISSGFLSARNRESCVNSGAFELINKPFSLEELYDVIERATAAA